MTIHEHLRLFPTHVLSFKNDDHKNDEWLDYIRTHSDQSKYGLQTRSTLHDVDLFQPLIDVVSETIREIHDVLGYDDQYELEFTSMWGQILAPNQAFFPHMHANNVWSGAHNVAAAANETRNTIEFFDPRPQAHVLTPAKKRRIPDTGSQLLLHPAVGWGVIFPSWLQHWVPNVPTEGRCSISRNVLMRSEYDSRESKQWARF